MNAKLLGSLGSSALAVTLGLALAAGCGGSSSEVADANDSGGADATTGADSGSSDAGTTDAAKDSGSDGAITVPGTEQTVQYGSCTTFAPCGGDPKGTWTYAAGGCLDEFDLSSCAGATVTNTSIKVKGQVTIAATTLDRVAQITAGATVGIPQSCVDAIPIPAFRTCSGIETGLKLAPPTGPGFDTATCTSKGVGQGCDCVVSKTTVDQKSTTYTVAGNTITTAGGDTYDFCVNPASTMTYRETTPGVQQAATLVMTK
jgi:hypothetical protein